MRLLQFTAGAGAMYCGSCLHSNTLALHLSALGVDVTLVPLYTPTRTDEKNASTGHVFFGGVSVYLEESVPFMRRLPKIFDALWDSKAALYAVGLLNTSTDPASLGPMTVSMLRGEAGHQKKEVEHLSALARQAAAVRRRPDPLRAAPRPGPHLKARGLKVACELQGEDFFLDGLVEPWKSEAKGLIAERARDVELFIAGSRYYADMMSADLKIPREKIRIVPHGIDIDERLMTLKSAHTEEFTVGYFARIAPEKGLHVLAEAYIRFRERHPERKARLAAGGYLAGEHRPYLLGIEDKLRAAGRESRVPLLRRPRSPGEVRVPAQPRSPGRTHAVPRTQGPVRHGGDGLRRPRGAAAPWRVSGVDRSHRRRSSSHRGRRRRTGGGAGTPGRRPRGAEGDG